MYQTLTFYHSIVRWFVLVSLIYAIYRAYRGYTSKGAFTKADDALRHWTATIAHIQLVIGIVLYSQSPIVKYFWSNFKEAIHHLDIAFFGLIHIVLMLTAIVVVTIGSALSKRKQTDQEKFKTMLIWFSISLIIIFIAIPWPFSP
ncbi:MAG: hypothetical protein HYZ42_00055, partial [Bacteroidetes bacterium]|nr:hypothetical protein [Bacteroidota bacterium]